MPKIEGDIDNTVFKEHLGTVTRRMGQEILHAGVRGFLEHRREQIDQGGNRNEDQPDGTQNIFQRTRDKAVKRIRRELEIARTVPQSKIGTAIAKGEITGIEAGIHEVRTNHSEN